MFEGTVIGNLTKDANLRYSKNGKPFCAIGVAVNSGKDQYKTTTYVQIVTFGKLAEACGRLVTGQQVIAHGRVEEYSGQHKGKDYKIFKLVSNYVGLMMYDVAKAEENTPRQIPPKQEPAQQSNTGQQYYSQDNDDSYEFTDEDIPF